MKKTVFAVFASFGCVAFGFSGSAHAQKWADLTMTIVLDGDAPAPQKIDAKADPVCAQFDVISEDLVVDPSTKAIANMVFMIDPKKTKIKASQLPPELQKVPEEKPVLDNLKCVFVPRVLAMRAGQTLVVKNSDQTGHNANFGFFKNDPLNPMIAVGGSKEVDIKLEESGATLVKCNIHSWMSAYVFVTNHPYVGISDAKGKIKIEKIPAGIPLNFKLWHESQKGLIEELSVGGKKETWEKGSVELTLKEGVNDLGTILIKSNRFKTK